MAKPPFDAPWKPVEYGLREAAAIQALYKGEATPEQQKQALDWIIQEVCRRDDQSYRSNSQRDTDFAEGKRFVGNTLVKLIKINTANLRKDHV